MQNNLPNGIDYAIHQFRQEAFNPALSIALDVGPDEDSYGITMDLDRRIVIVLNDCSFLLNQMVGGSKRAQETSALVQTINELISELLISPVEPKKRRNEPNLQSNLNLTLVDYCKDNSIVPIGRSQRSRVISVLTKNRDSLVGNIDAIDKHEKLYLLMETNETVERLLELPIKKFIKDNFCIPPVNPSTSTANNSNNQPSSLSDSMKEHQANPQDDIIDEESSSADQSDKPVESKANSQRYKSNESDKLDAKPNLKDLTNRTRATSNPNELNNSIDTSMAELIDLTSDMSEDDISEIEIENESRDVRSMNFDRLSINSTSSAKRPNDSQRRSSSEPVNKRLKMMQIDSYNFAREMNEVVEQRRFRLEFKKMEEFLNDQNQKKRSVSFTCFNNEWFLRVYSSSSKAKRANQNNKYIKIGLVRNRPTDQAEPTRLQVAFTLKLVNSEKNNQDRIQVFKKAIFEKEQDTCWCRDKFVNYHDLENKFIRDDNILIDIFIESVKVLE